MKQQTKRWWVLSLSILLLLATTISVWAQDPTPTLTLTVAGEDNPLIIRGRLDGQNSSFSGNVRLTVAGGDTEELLLLSSDLKHDGRSEWDIDRSNITIPTGVSLRDGQPTDVRVTVSNALHPGTYTGDLQILLPGQAVTEALVIKLELHLDAAPQVVPIAPALSWQVVHCDNRVDCLLAMWFLPASAVQDNWQVWLDNQTAQAVEVLDGIAILPGATSGIAPMPDQVTPQTPITLPANQPMPITVTVHRQQLAPDSYQGTLRFTLKGTDETITIPTTLSVRRGPLWALLVVLVGILLGRLVRNMETDTAQVQIKLLPEYYRLRASANDLKEAQDRADALDQLEAFKRRLDRGNETEEVLSVLAEIEARVAFYTSLEALYDSLNSLSYTLQDELADKFAAARKAVRDGRQSDAERYYAQIREEIEKVAEDSLLRGDGQSVREAITKELAVLQENIERLATPVVTRTKSRWFRFLSWLSGIRLNADVRFWIVRPILSLTLLILLVLWGVQELYVTAGTTFGAAGIYDYTALLLWGLTADVVSRSLSNLSAKLG